jgi:YfiH family protein
MEDNKYSVITAVSTRKDGSMMSKNVVMEENAVRFLDAQGVPFKKTHFMKQVHGNKIAYVNGKSKQILEDVDGMITNKPNVFLAVATADCIPILLSDQEANIVGVAHAGYKGILAGVIENLIAEAVRLGAYMDDIYISVGPAIGVCCYDIDAERVKHFTQRFSTDRIFRFTEEKIYLDLKKAVKILLEKEGIKSDNITISNECTSDSRDKYFSYRVDTTETFGEMISVIGMTNQ